MARLANTHTAARTAGIAPALLLQLSALIASGCGVANIQSPGPLFQVPLLVEGVDVGGAIVDTGGGYEVLLAEAAGLQVVDTVDVLLFGGLATVDVTQEFSYQAGGIDATATAAIVDPSICSCNGLGFLFLRKTGLVLSLDFDTPSVLFLTEPAEADVFMPFRQGPASLSDFDTSFIDVDVAVVGEGRTVRALVDSGATVTVMRRGLVGSIIPAVVQRQQIRITHQDLGAVDVEVGLFDTSGLPDLIIGTDVMNAWGSRWQFEYFASGGRVMVLSRRGNVAPVVAN